MHPLPCSTPLATPTSLVEEEMRFWSQYNFDDEGDNDSLPVEKITEAPKGTIFAMQKNFALKGECYHEGFFGSIAATSLVARTSC